MLSGIVMKAGNRCFCPLENYNGYCGYIQEKSIFLRLIDQTERGATATGQHDVDREREIWGTFSQYNSPRSFHPLFWGRWRKLSAKLSACVSPVSLLLPQSPNTEGAQSEEQTYPKLKLMFILIWFILKSLCVQILYTKYWWLIYNVPAVTDYRSFKIPCTKGETW